MTSLDDWLGESIPDVIMTDAADWMTRLDADRCTLADRLAFARWLDEDSRHRAAFEELSEVWAKLRILTDLEPDSETRATVVPFPAARAQMLPRVPEPRPARDWSTAAVVAVLVTGLLAHVAWRDPLQRFETGPGEISAVTLDDGSRIELNTRTEIALRFDRRQRLVTLQSGEAVFHVADDERPFVVETGGGSVTASSSSFSVEADGRALEVGMLVGEASVVPRAPPPMLTELVPEQQVVSANPVIRLAAGQGLALLADGQRRLLGSAAQIEAALSWRDGVVTFEDLPLRQVVEEMRRYGEVFVHIADPSLNPLRISGQFPTADPGAFLPALAARGDIVIDEAAPGWVVLRAALDGGR